MKDTHSMIIFAALAVPVIGGVAATRLWVTNRQRKTIAGRLARWSAPVPKENNVQTLLKRAPFFPSFLSSLSGLSGAADSLKLWFIDFSLALGLDLALEGHFSIFLAVVLSLLLLPLLVAFVLGASLLVAGIIGLALATVPFFIVKGKADGLRTKFCEQLPDAIDLMVAVLRSGHSVSQAVKAVADECPQPCGPEFESVLHKMNLGQPLSQSLIASALRFRSYELDLIRRAVAIQSEVGGSLAELLDKTNSTLRQRLKLAQQLKVVTAQSRLSAQIVGILPVILALGLNVISPGYLNLLLQDTLGRGLLLSAVFLEVIGIFIMRKMSTMKV